jgi:hypothetical protein
MYTRAQQESSSTSPTSTHKKSNNSDGERSFSVQRQPEINSSQEKERPSYSRNAADLLAANVMRSMAAREQGEEAQGAASVAQVVMPKPELPLAPVASVFQPLGEMGIQPQCSACQQGMEDGKDSDAMSSVAGVQTKLTVGAVGDRYEQEADRVAAQVMRMSIPPDHSPQVQRFGEKNNPVQRWSLAQSITPMVHRRVDEQVQMRELVQRAFQAGGNEASGDLENRLNASKGGGSALAPEVRAFMEPRFGTDFSSVRVHTGSEAVQMNRELGAQAFTHGSDVYFGAGKSPGNNELTAHELTHVVQQTGVISQKLTTNSSTMSPIQEQIQRDGEEGANPLTPVQVGIAKSWYAGRRTQYTPEIIRQIQTSLGVGVTGIINDETVQAVARWQQSNPPLKVDGMAGPRSLPALFSSGLARSDEMDQYVTEAKQVQTNWATLATAQARADALMVIVNARLTSAGVPTCVGVLRDLGAAAGQLDFPTWQIDLGQQAFSRATITDDQAAEIANTVYHEARHAEQWFRMAQMLAGQGRAARQIEIQMGIPARIAVQAFSNPLAQGSMEALIAQGWYESVYGARANYRNRVLTEALSSKTALDAAQTAFDTNPTPANQARLTAARRRFDVAYQKYVDLPEEADAHRVGNAVEARYRLP